MGGIRRTMLLPACASFDLPAMSSEQTTTTNSSFILKKYSRSYPNASGEETSTADSWQHFINPVIKTLVDVQKSPRGDLTSVRLRILWLWNGGNDSMELDEREVVFVSMIFFYRRVNVYDLTRLFFTGRSRSAFIFVDAIERASFDPYYRTHSRVATESRVSRLHRRHQILVLKHKSTKRAFCEFLR